MALVSCSTPYGVGFVVIDDNNSNHIEAYKKWGKGSIDQRQFIELVPQDQDALWLKNAKKVRLP